MDHISELRVIDALVDTPDAETPYRRAGTGAPVLLLADALAGTAAAADLFATLATAFRVYAPLAAVRADGRVCCGPGGGADAAPAVDGPAWLCSLIDGLGLDRPTVVADVAFAATALAFARNDPERVARVVLTAAGEPAGDTLRRLLALSAPIAAG